MYAPTPGARPIGAKGFRIITRYGYALRTSSAFLERWEERLLLSVVEKKTLISLGSGSRNTSAGARSVINR